MNNGLMITTQSGSLNLNIDQKTLDACLKAVNRFGDTLYMNICTGQQVSIPTGSFDWFIFFVAMFFVIVIGFILIFVIIDLTRGY